MPDVLVYFNESRYLSAKAHLENTATQIIQPVIDQYATLDIAVLSQEDLGQLFTNPVDLVFDKLTGGSVVIGGNEVTREKAIELIKKPMGYESFIALVNQAIDDLKRKMIPTLNLPIYPSNVASYFELSEELIVSLKESKRAQVEEIFKVYAKSEAAKKAYEFAQDIIDKHEELGLGTLTKSMGNGLPQFISDILYWEFGKSELSVKVEGIERLNSNKTLE